MYANTLIGDMSAVGYQTGPAPTNGAVHAVQSGDARVVDGTPLRVVAVAVAAAAGLVALRWAGIRFNVGASL